MSKAPNLRRRSFLLGLAPAVAGTLGTIASSASGEPEDPGAKRSHLPVFFNSAEWSFLNASVDRLIPDDGNGPGGLDAGVAVFIDRQMEAPYGHGAYWYMQGPFYPDTPATLGYQLRYTPRDLYRLGIAAADRAFLAAKGLPFSKASAEDRDAFLSQLEAGTVQLDGPPAAIFFGQLLTNVREGYFADPMYGGNRDMAAWKAIGFPGARADFTDWLDQQGRAYPFGPVAIEGDRG